ncbi:LysE family translocator [Emticicia sp. SJ17W-69]|uniref:LysE family translocator n=1 Tax=Emticicia sp. SJ17W-69 TaxID=3421657 RepID=UPI003EBD393A
MLEAISLGFFTGIVLSFGFGSVFFALIQDSIENGYQAGIKISLGVVFGDILMVFIAFLGTSFLPNIPNFGFYSRIFGSILLISLGVFQFIQSKPSTKKKDFKLARFFYFFGKGFLLNVINPVNFISWMVISASLKSYKYDIYDEIAFFSTCILMIFVVESVFALSAYKIKNKMSEKTIQYIKYISGIVFIVVGLKLIYDAF